MWCYAGGRNKTLFCREGSYMHWKKTSNTLERLGGLLCHLKFSVEPGDREQLRKG